jgi:hypothetical protein
VKFFNVSLSESWQASTPCRASEDKRDVTGNCDGCALVLIPPGMLEKFARNVALGMTPQEGEAPSFYKGFGEERTSLVSRSRSHAPEQLQKASSKPITLANPCSRLVPVYRGIHTHRVWVIKTGSSALQSA